MRGGVKGHLPQPLFIPLPDFSLLFGGEIGIWLALIDEKLVGDDIPPAVQQDAVGRGAVPPRTPGLLIIALDILRHIVVQDKGRRSTCQCPFRTRWSPP